jgi:ABC-2 type transport system ATP-binding protein
MVKPCLDEVPVIGLENVIVEYRVPVERVFSFKEYAIQRFQGKVGYKFINALEDVSFNIYRGEVFGIIGRNGAGKSTLMQLVARVLKPTSGRVWVKGRIAPILSIGAGFHTELTGRENIFLNGTLLGFSRREMQKRVDAIIDFAELEEFIDSPMRTYSSGMQARLGFAVAMDVEPDILLLDEVMAVGDEVFQKKCQVRFQTFCEKGITIVLVSHTMSTIEKMCDRAVLLHEGHLVSLGYPDMVIKDYRKIQN